MDQHDFEQGRLDRASQGLPILREANQTLPGAFVSNIHDATLRSLTEAIWRHRGVIIAVALAFIGCAGIYVAQKKPVYTSEGAIVVASRVVMIPGVEAVSTPTGDLAIIRSEMGVLGSRTLLQQVAQGLHLDADPEFNPLLRPKDDGFLARLDPRPFLHRLLSQGPGKPIDQHAYVAAAVEATLQENLMLINGQTDHIIQVRYRSENPETSAAVVNTLMDRYLAQYAQIKDTAAEDAGSVLASRADQLRRDADQADAAVANFIKSNRFVETKSGSINGQQLEDLNTQLAAARADRAAAEARYNDALSLSRGGTSASGSEVLASPLIQALRTREVELSSKQVELSQQLGPGHPDVQAIQAQLVQLRGTIQSEINKITTSLKGLADVARARETGLEARLEQLQGAAVSGNTAFNEFQQLKAVADAKRQIYAAFLSKVAEAARAGDKQPIEARIISSAVAPIEPTKARGLLFILIAGVVGTLVAIAGCLVYDQLDRGFSTLDQVRAATGFPAYAAIPPARGRRSRSNLSRYLVDNPYSTLAETLRGVRARLRRTTDDQRVILVTSAQPGEGKTTFALALAQVMAGDGLRTLLIEGDTRRPILRRVLSPTGCAEPADVLLGKVPWQERMGRDDRTGLYYFVASRPSSNFPTLMDQHDNEGPIGQMKTAFDYVIIDSPPVMRAADATILARFVDLIVVVVSAKRTRQRTVAEALRRLLIVTKPIGIVLTNSAEKQDVYAGYGPNPRRRWAGFASHS